MTDQTTGDDEDWNTQDQETSEDWSDGPTAPGEDWTDQNWPESQQNDIEEENIEGRPPPGKPLPEGMESLEKMFVPDEEIPEGEKPIEMRTSEAEKLYANLLMVTDFEEDFIEEILEFEPDEASRMRINELRRKRREMKEMAVPSSAHQPKTILL